MSLPGGLPYKRSFLILKKLGGIWIIIFQDPTPKLLLTPSEFLEKYNIKEIQVFPWINYFNRGEKNGKEKSMGNHTS